jgi:OHCU decarboxylase
MSSLEDFNALDRDAAVDELMTACHSRRWAAQVADARPLLDLASLQQVADDVWLGLDPADWREALDGHPRIGEQGGSCEEFSEREQSGMRTAGEDVRTAIARGNQAYEQRFGHVFLISASGRTPDEILENLTSRLGNDAEDELRVAAEQHRRITRLRLEKLFG